MSPALDFMSRRARPLGLVIFDCDGVLVDSEPVSAEVVAAAVSELGWLMTPAESQTNFLGMTFGDMVPEIERRTGRKLPPDWREDVVARLIAAFAHDLKMIPGALEALDAMDAMGMPWRIGSNSSPEELAAKFAAVGLSERVRGRVLSHRDVARGKPAPDLFLAAAADAGVAPEAAIVVEDSVTGVRAATAAGMDCLGFAPEGDGAALAAEGAVPFRAMRELPGLVRAALEGRARERTA